MNTWIKGGVSSFSHHLLYKHYSEKSIIDYSR